jgi:TonB family protein
MRREVRLALRALAALAAASGVAIYPARAKQAPLACPTYESDDGSPGRLTPPPPPPAPGTPEYDRLVRNLQIITTPTWLVRPTPDDMMRVYPKRLFKPDVSGRAEIDCQVHVDGSTFNCVVASEAPAHRGFGEAALKLMASARMRPMTINGAPCEGARFHVPLGWDIPAY